MTLISILKVIAVVLVIVLPLGWQALWAQGETLTVRLERDAYEKDDILFGEVMGLDSGERATIQLQDSFGRVLAELDTMQPSRGRLRFAFELDIPFTIEQSVVCTTSTGKKGSASFILKPANYRWDDYYVIMWGGGDGAPEAYFDACRRVGVNMGMCYRGRDPDSFVKNNFRYYLENMIPKGGLYLKREDWRALRAEYEKTRDPKLLVRAPCLNDPGTLAEWKGILRELIAGSQDHRPLAYNLGDEISVTSFVNPFDFCFGPYCLREFRRWLSSIYPSLDDLNDEWGTGFRKWEEVVPSTTDAIRKQEFAEGKGLFNFSSWADHRSFMDTTFAKCLSELVSYCNTLDPLIPVGMEGGQAPSAFGGYDWWKLMQVTQWQEPYDIGESREIIRSFNQAREQRIPVVSTHFARTTANQAKLGKHEVWRRFMHGDRGSIIWWNKTYFNENFQPSDYAQAMAGTFLELESGLGKLFAHPDFSMQPDPVAIYYSQSSIQAHWMLDSRGDGATWIRRFGGYERQHSTLIKERTAWVRLLEDIGLQYNFLSYEQIADGALLSHNYRVLIMPKTIALSAAEIAAIQRFVSGGGTVIADSQIGLMDEHCKMTGGGRLDELFAIKRSGYRTAEVDGAFTTVTEDKLVEASVSSQLAKLLTGVEVARFKVVEPDISARGRRALASAGKIPALIVNEVGGGRAVYLNISMLDYLEARKTPGAGAHYQKLLQNLLSAAGVQARVTVLVHGKPMPSIERMLYRLGNNWYLAIIPNRPVSLSDKGIFQVEGLPAEEQFTIDVNLGRLRPHVYNMRKDGAESYLTQTSYFRDALVAWEANLYALLPYRVERVELRGAPGPNRTVPFTIEVIPREPLAEVGTHILHLSLLDGEGKAAPHYQANLVAVGGWVEGRFKLALNEPPGDYVLRATDVATGLLGEINFVIPTPEE